MSAKDKNEEKWFDWKGGKRPVASKDRVKVAYKSGLKLCGVGSDFSWKYYGDENDIVSYKILYPPEQ